MSTMPAWSKPVRGGLKRCDVWRINANGPTDDGAFQVVCEIAAIEQTTLFNCGNSAGGHDTEGFRLTWAVFSKFGKEFTRQSISFPKLGAAKRRAEQLWRDI